jgi:cell division protease FtsH
VLLVGLSGTGKTLLAKAVAGEANVPFFSMAGSEFMEMLVGVGASRVRDLFSTAKKAAPSIIFIDEIDAIGRQRATGVFSGGHDEREQTLNQILVEMDGFTTNDNVIVLAATNRGDLLDSALLRPGRFDRRVTLDLPDVEGRQAILKIHAQGKVFAPAINWPAIAKQTVGFSGADLENMLNEAAILAARQSKLAIDDKDIREASVKVKLGPERKRLQSLEDRRLTAYHEAGHALVGYYSPNTDPVRRVSIVARGMSLGHTMITPAKDRSHETKKRLEEQISVMMGGRAAEQLIFKEMTTGAANDIAGATRLARAMVVNFGMSKLGPIYLAGQSEEGDFGKMLWYEPAGLSPETQAKIDAEIGKITDIAYRRASKLIKAHRAQIDILAAALLDKETLEEEEFEKIMKAK